MIDWLVGILSPTFESMGASATDISNYAHELAPQIYAIFGILAAVILVMILAQFLVKKGSRAMVRGVAALLGLAGLVIVLNTIAFGSGLHDNIANILNNLGKGVGDASANSVVVQDKVGDEGIVLAENDDILPLAENSKLNVFGWSSVYPIFGGTGSGSSDSSTSVDIIQSLTDAGFEVNRDLIDFYKAYKDGRGGSALSISFTDWSLPEPPVSTYEDSLISDAKSFSDTAIIVIARSGGEGQDEPLDMGAVIDGSWNEDHLKDANGNENYAYFASAYENNGDYDDFEKGEHYLELSKTERDLVDMVTSNFSNVIIVVNANNAMELGWTEDYEAIKGVLLAPGTGQSAMSGLGLILSGAVNPSGRTVDTYVADLTKTPTYNNFGSFVYDNVSDLLKAYTEADDSYEGVISFVNYVEGIYVGYKYYETADVEGTINYDEEVVYPFGYGLSYTTFEQTLDLHDNGDSVTATVTVKNTGDVAGKDVVELYYTAPYTNGGIEKSAVNLIDFEKTKLLEPGEEQTIEITINKEDMASYDSEGIKIDGGGYILEAGEYTISARANSHEVLAEATFKVDSDIDYSKDGRSTDATPAVNQLNDFSKGEGIEYLSRKDKFANYDKATAAPTDFSISDEAKAAVDEYSIAHYDYTKYEDPNAKAPTIKAQNGLSLADMVGKDYDDPDWELLLDEMKIPELKDIALGGFFSTSAVNSIDKVKTTDSDGPTGLNNWAAGVYGTPFPTEVLVAQTWNKELAYEVGTAMGAEYVATGTYGWYGPAMNTHRSAFGGRNFEYYSEDGVLAGKIAAQVVDAAAEQGVYAYIKHFALNDQETNRCGMLNTFATEQAIREIYLKPFEAVVKSQPKTQAVMSSFNYIGTRYAGACSPLLNNILRDEWGFRGTVLTDWYGRYGYMIPMDVLRNGGDLMLNTATPTDIADDRSATLLNILRNAAKDVCYTVVNSAAYTGGGSTGGGGLDQMTLIFGGIDIVTAVVALGGSALLIKNNLKKKKEAA